MTERFRVLNDHSQPLSGAKGAAGWSQAPNYTSTALVRLLSEQEASKAAGSSLLLEEASLGRKGSVASG